MNPSPASPLGRGGEEINATRYYSTVSVDR